MSVPAACSLRAGLLALLGIAVLPLAATAADPKPIPIAEIKSSEKVSFEKQILPILRRNCLACHNATEAESDLVLESPETIRKGGAEGPAAVAGKGAASLMVVLAAHQKEPLMPPEDNDVGAKPLTSQELGLLKLWIDQGAAGSVSGDAAKITWTGVPASVAPVNAVAISPDGRYAVAGRGNQIYLYHVQGKRLIGLLSDPDLAKNGPYKSEAAAHLDLVQSLDFSPDGRRIASGGFRTVKIWTRPEAAPAAEIKGVDAKVTAAVTSPDGKHSAMGLENGKVLIADAKTGAAVRTLPGHSAAVTGLAYTADGAQIVTGSQDKTVRIFSAADGKELAKLETPAAVSGVALVSDGKLVVTGHADNKLRTWTLSEGKLTDKPVKEIAGHGGPITSLSAVPKAPTQVLSASQDGTARIYDANSGGQVRQFSVGGPVTAAAIAPDGQRVAAASSSGFVKLYNAANGQQVAELKGDFRLKHQADEAGRAVQLTQRQQKNATDDVNEAKKRLDAEKKNQENAKKSLTTAEGELKKKQEAAKKPLEEKQKAEEALKKTQEELAKAEKAEKDAKDDAAKKKAKAELQKAQQAVKQAESKLKQVTGPADKALAERQSAERAIQAAERSVKQAADNIAKAQQRLTAFETAAKQAEQAVKDAQAAQKTAAEAAGQAAKPVLTVAFSADGQWLATGGEDSSLYVLDAQTGAPLEAQPAGGPLLALAPVGDSRFLAATDKAAHFRNAAEPWILERVIGSPDSTEAFTDRVTAVDFGPQGKLLATGGGEPSRSGEIKIWNVADGKLVRAFQDPHSDTVFSLEFSPDGQFIASAAADRFAKIFNVADGKLVRPLEGHTHHVMGISWRCDGRMLATSGADNVIKVWDARTGDQKRTISNAFKKEIAAVRFLGLGDDIVAAAGDKQVSIKRTSNGGNVRNFPAGDDFMYDVAASADGKTIAAGGADGVLRVWSDDGQTIATFERPKPKEPAENTQAAK